MATFPDLRSLNAFLAEANHTTLALPIGGREYTWDAHDLPLRAMLKLQRVELEAKEISRRIEAGETINPNVIVMDDAAEQQFGEDLIGQANLDQMATDGVTWAEVQHVMATLMAWYLNGEHAAHAVWTGELSEVTADPPAPAGSTPTAGSSTTRNTPPARGSGGSRSSRTGTSSKPTSNGAAST